MCSNNYSTPSVEPVSININFEEEHGQQPVKSAYHSFYIYPRKEGNKSNSPNLLWHELKTQGRGRSLSPKPEAKASKILTRESSMPISSLLVKKSMEENNKTTSNNKPEEKPEENKIKDSEEVLAVNKTKAPSQRRQISRERVDKALEILR